MMEQCIVLTVTVILLVSGCFGQRLSELNNDSERTRQLENIVVQLLTKFEEVLASKQDDEVGFSLSLSKDIDLEISGQNIKFDTVGENIGNGYNTETGEFVCPVTGTYIFALNIACNIGSYVEVSIEVNNNGTPRYILNAVCDHRKRAGNNGYGLYCGHTQNGGTVIARLQQGEKVSVIKIKPITRVTVTGSGLTTFSGYLLRPS